MYNITTVKEVSVRETLTRFMTHKHHEMATKGARQKEG